MLVTMRGLQKTMHGDTVGLSSLECRHSLTQWFQIEHPEVLALLPCCFRIERERPVDPATGLQSVLQPVRRCFHLSNTLRSHVWFDCKENLMLNMKIETPPAQGRFYLYLHPYGKDVRFGTLPSKSSLYGGKA